MTNKTEDRFYFGKPGQPERFQIGGNNSRAIQTVVSAIEKAISLLSQLPGDQSIKGPIAKIMQQLFVAQESARAISRGQFSRPGQPAKFRRATDEEIETLLLEAESLIDDGFSSKAIPFLRKASNSIDMHTDAKLKKVLADLMREANVRFSRPGQPERFGLEDACWEGYEPVGTKQKDGRTVPNCVPKDKNEQPEEFGSESPRIKAMESQLSDWIRQRDLLVKDIKRNPNDERAQRHLTRVRQEINALITQIDNAKRGASFSRPGSPDKFDASSLDRGNFAEASKSPMLGKLLAAKVMPDGGWRAVQVGSDTLVISFEDADLARDFGRRASTKGYSATSPVATTGRYWNVEVKNGKV